MSDKSMLIIREDAFCRINGKLYIVGSANNELYRNNVFQMGRITVLAWEVDASKYDLSRLKEFENIEGCEIHLHPENVSFREKVRIIREEVKGSDCVCVKMTLLEAYWGCHYALKYHKPFVIESGTWAWGSLKDHGGSVKYKLAALPMELLAKYYHRRSKYIIYVSRFYLQKYYKSSAKQIGCPDVVLQEVGNEVLERRIGMITSKNRQSKFVLGLIGQSHVEYRGHDTLIKTAATLKEAGYNVEVRFLGGGSADDKRRKFAEECGIADDVYFDGYMEHNKVLEWIDGIDVLVMPTLQETLGRSIIEAMGRGCPVIGSSETAIPEQIGSDCIAPARDVWAISRIIKKMAENTEYMKLCAIENFYRAKKYNSSYSNAEKKQFYDEFYRDNNL